MEEGGASFLSNVQVHLILILSNKPHEMINPLTMRLIYFTLASAAIFIRSNNG